MPRAEAIVGEAQAQRLDKFVAEAMGALSRSQIKALSARLFVNGKEAKPSRKVRPGDRVALEWEELPLHSLEGEDIALKVVYEDDSVIVVNKAQGMVCHPGAGNWHGTLVQAVLGRLEGFSPPAPKGAEAGAWASPQGNSSGGYPRPGIVHRLDKDTSGVIIVAKNPQALEFLARQFRQRSVRKLYLAIVEGQPRPAQGRIEGCLCRDPRERKRFTVSATKGKRALSLYKTLRSLGNGLSLVLLMPKTGRTHQLRVHMKSIGCPILGDPIYGRRSARPDQASLMLHAYSLRIRVPGQRKKSRFIAKIPARFKPYLSPDA